jgi:hypothetical protein
MTIGGQRAAVGGSGLAEAGSATDILRNSQQQGALATATLQMQGQMTKAGYTEQAASYGIMASTANTTASSEQQIAGQYGNIQQQQLALAGETLNAGQTAATGDFLGGVLKGAASIASLI